MRRRISALALLIIAALGLSACFASHAGSAANIGVRFSGSIFSGGKPHGCIKAGDRITTSDHVYYLPGPGNQRQDQWQTGNKDADHTDMSVTSSDGVQFTMQLNENFGMNADCDTLTKFMQTIGLTRKAYFETDGSYLPGWITAMNYYISPVVVRRARAAISQYTAAELWPSTKVYDDVEKAINNSPTGGSFEDEVTTRTNGNDFYNQFSADVSVIQPNATYAASIAARQKAKTDAQTAQYNAKSAVAQAQANAKIAKAKALVTKAEISAYPSIAAYLKAQVIAAGGNPFQPQYIVGGTVQSGQ